MEATTSNKKLLAAPGLTTRSKDATNGAPGIATSSFLTSNKKATSSSWSNDGDSPDSPGTRKGGSLGFGHATHRMGDASLGAVGALLVMKR